MKRSYLIHAPGYDENVGGIMMLHFLCHLLNSMGEEAYLIDAREPRFTDKSPLSLIKVVRKRLSRKFRRLCRRKGSEFKTNPSFNTPLGNSKMIADSIVVYPEVVSGNPLNAERVVRWLLYTPGFFGDMPDLSKSDLVFAYRQDFNTMKETFGEVPTLKLRHVMTDIYRQTNHGERHGTCYILRKGDPGDYVHDKDDIRIDGMSHEEISRLFNQCEYFISYDPYTFYSVYAALCGCKSVVISDKAKPSDPIRPGVAMGFDDLPNALAATDQLHEYIRQINESNLESVRAFIQKCEAAFQ